MIERVAYEAPGYVLDYMDAARWTSVSTPTLKALDIEDEARVLAIGEPAIVRLTKQPKDHKVEEDQAEF